MKKYLFFLFVPSLLLGACNDDDDNNTPPEKAQVDNVNDLQSAINQGVKEVTLTTPLTSDATLAIPQAFGENTEISINIPAGGKKVTIEQNNSGVGRMASILDLVINNGGDLIIDTPDMTVNFDGKVDGTLTASTAGNTLVIARTATINKLVVRKGNVHVFGTVTSVGSIADNSKVLWAVSTAAELHAQLAKPASSGNGGVILTADISDEVSDYNSGNQDDQDVFNVGPYREPDQYYRIHDLDGYIFDGNGHTISGVANKNIINVTLNSAIIRNLTIEQTQAQKDKRKTNGLTIYRSKNVRLENVTVRNVGNAAVVINASTATATELTTSGNGWGGVNLSLGTNPPNGEAPAFTLENGNLGETAKIWVDLGSMTTPISYTVNVPEGETWYWGEYDSSKQRVYSTVQLSNADRTGTVTRR